MPIKPQDIIFIIILAVLLYKRDPKYFTYAGLASIVIAIPFFYKWIFFTAERLVLYAFIFFVIAVILHIIRLRYENRN